MLDMVNYMLTDTTTTAVSTIAPESTVIPLDSNVNPKVSTSTAPTRKVHWYDAAMHNIRYWSRSIVSN